MSGSTRPRTIVNALDDNADETSRGFTFVGDDHRSVLVSFAELRTAVSRAARVLTDSGIAPDDRIALIVPDAREFVTAFLAVTWAGAIPVPIYPPAGLGKQDTYLDYVETLLNSVEARGLVTPGWVDQVLGLGARFGDRVPVIVHTEDIAAGELPGEAADRTADHTVFLQFTSGSTGTPKAVQVNDASLWANAESFRSGLRCTPEQDHVVSWLPLYHDLGLVGHMLGPLLLGIEATFIPTLAFLRDPTIWLDTISRQRGTISFAPNFAFALTAKKANPPEGGWDLSSMRVFGCGAEPINPIVLDTFIDAFVPHGLKPQAVVPGYGMAEATVGVCFDSLDDRFRALSISPTAYREENRVQPPEPGEQGLTFVSCGRVLDDKHTLRIVDDNGRELPEGQVGNVQFHGPSRASGYFRNEDATAAVFLDNGWLQTGDHGFILDGDFYITGRKKDVLVINGRNHDPQHVEWAAGDVPGIRKGNVIAFSIPGEDTEQIVIAAERTTADDDHEATVRRAVWGRTRLNVADVVFLNPGQLPKTSSGKIQRSRARELYLSGDLVNTVVATRTHAHSDPVTT